MKSIAFILTVLFSTWFAVNIQASVSDTLGKGNEQYQKSVQTETLTAQINYEGNEQLQLLINNIGTLPVKIKILVNGSNVFTDRFEPNAFAQRTYNIAQLPKGEHTIRFIVGNKIYERIIVKTSISTITFE